MSRKNGMVKNIGIVSMILIVLAFVLTAFAVLSIKASYSEYRFAKKTGSSVQTYYTADSKAEEMLAYIDTLLHTEDIEKHLEKFDTASSDAGIDGITNLSYQMKKDEHKKKRLTEIWYEVVINEKTSLKVALEIDADYSYRVITWKVVAEPMGDYGMDFETDELWDGDVSTE